MHQMKARVEKNLWSDQINIWLYQEKPDGRVAVSSNVVMEVIEVGHVVPAAPIQLDVAQAQSLMNQLWEAGLRPSQGSGSAGSLAATERHLQDMRSLVFKMTPKA